MISPEFPCRLVCLNALKTTFLPKKLPPQSPEAGYTISYTRYDKPGGCTYACQHVHANIKRMRKGQKRKKPCRTHQDKIIFDPISKGIAQRRNTQMKARKDNAKEKDKAHSCLAAYRQQKLKQKRTQKQRLSFLPFQIPTTDASTNKV